MPRGRAWKAISLIIVLALVAMVVSSLARYDFSVKALWKDAVLAAEALREKYYFKLKYLAGKEKYEIYHNLWYRTDRRESGVTVYDREKATGDLIFYSGHDSSAFLIDMDGNVVHMWHKPFSEVWPEPEHIYSTVPDNQIYWRRAELMPNGDILAIYEGINQVPYGGGLIKLDRDSNLIWRLDINAHHDLYVDNDGTIIVLFHVYEKSAITGRPIISDALGFVSPDGELTDSRYFLSPMYNSPYRDLFDWDDPDLFHVNNVELLTGKLSAVFPMFEAGDMLISMNGAKAVLVVDGSSLEPKWALAGITNTQHDPDFMEDGTIRIFDNLGGDDPAVDRSRIIDVNPSDNSIAWSYNGSPKEPFLSISRGSQQTLEGGNILITEATGGRIFEITPQGEIVWEFVDPGLDGQSIGVVNWATCHRRDELPFLRDK